MAFAGCDGWREEAAVDVAVDDVLTFQESVSVWIGRPNVINRRLTHAAITRRFDCDEDLQVSHLLEWVKEEKGWVESSERELLRFQVTVRRLVPREMIEETEELVEAIVQDREKHSYTFIPISNSVSDSKLLEVSTYKIALESTSKGNGSCLKLYVPVTDLPRLRDQTLCPSVKWLAEKLLPKLAGWMKARSKKSDGLETKWKAAPPNQLINEDKYSKLYRHLKEKYGRRMAEIWPEVTDPAKFVYEDVAIATYLLTLWEDERHYLQLSTKQSFVDLGCGNGLLVHILSQEGHPGYGIDLKQRKIWDMYGPKTVLKEAVIVPLEHQAFPDAEWLIGNHSDELTPWIPLLAARSSYRTRYFVLPCCFYDFNRKFSRQDGQMSQYQSYLEFVEMVGRRCGFNIKQDRLRIPSTKNICLIGESRSYALENENRAEIERQRLLDERCGSCVQLEQEQFRFGHGHDQVSDELQTGETPSQELISPSDIHAKKAVSFTPRPAVQAVRNCTKLNRDLVEEIVKTVAGELLKQDEIKVRQSGGSDLQQSDKIHWRRGGQLPISSAAALFEADKLSQLKREYGGLQTLLRNQHQVFEVTKGIIRLRNWRDEPVRSRKRQRRGPYSKKGFKTRLCWFHLNHPDGCPRTSADCSYAHGTSELSVSY